MFLNIKMYICTYTEIRVAVDYEFKFTKNVVLILFKILNFNVT